MKYFSIRNIFQVSLSSNFNKPLHSPEPVTARVDDIFTGFSFSSPLSELTTSDDSNNIRENTVKKKSSDYDPYENIELVKTTTMLNKTPASRTEENVRNNNISEEEEDVLEDMMNDNHARKDSLGARPKQSNTMDIRRKISEWYEEAEKEVIDGF